VPENVGSGLTRTGVKKSYFAFTVAGILWQRWLSLAHRIGEFQARLLLTLFYFVIVSPFALWVRIMRDPLALRRSGGPRWLARPSRPTTLEEVTKQ
jgi:hypothetical protein